jgi:hypothetical protein
MKTKTHEQTASRTRVEHVQIVEHIAVDVAPSEEEQPMSDRLHRVAGARDRNRARVGGAAPFACI